MSDERSEGGCLCGAVRFSVRRDGVVSAHHCHCRDCQRSTGSANTTFVMMPDAEFQQAQGDVKFYSVTGASGGSVSRGFCPECGSPLFSTVTVMPGLKFVKAAAFDDPSWVTPVSSFWTGSAPPWGHVDTAIEGFEANPRTR